MRGAWCAGKNSATLVRIARTGHAKVPNQVVNAYNVT